MARKLTKAQAEALAMIAADGDADGVYYNARGPTPGMARNNAEGTLNALRRRGLVVDTKEGWRLTDAGIALSTPTPEARDGG